MKIKNFKDNEFVKKYTNEFKKVFNSNKNIPDKPGKHDQLIGGLAAGVLLGFSLGWVTGYWVSKTDTSTEKTHISSSSSSSSSSESKVETSSSSSEFKDEAEQYTVYGLGDYVVGKDIKQGDYYIVLTKGDKVQLDLYKDEEESDLLEYPLLKAGIPQKMTLKQGNKLHFWAAEKNFEAVFYPVKEFEASKIGNISSSSTSSSSSSSSSTSPISSSSSQTETTPPPSSTYVTPVPSSESQSTPPQQNVYYANCTEVKNAGASPIYAGDPGYGRHLDRDGDGVGCES